MKEKVANGENIELDGVIIDNKTSVEETVQKEKVKAEPKEEVEEAPKTEVSVAEKQEPPKQEEIAPVATAEPEPEAEVTATSEIPAVSIPNNPTPEVPAYTPAYTQEVEPTYEPVPTPAVDNTYSTTYNTYVQADTMMNNQASYSQTVPPSSQTNTFDAEGFKNEIMNCVEKNVTGPFNRMNDAMVRARDILAKVKEQGYVTGSDHNVIEALTNEINSLINTHTFTPQYEMDSASNIPDYGTGMRF